MRRDEQNEDDWISLQEASDQLGIATATLRRWGDAGRVPMKRTLGGHRRFLHSAIVELSGAMTKSSAVVAQPSSHSNHWGVDERKLAQQDWHARLAERHSADRMRGLGQQLLGLLIQFINRQQDDVRFLDEARMVGAKYGREARASKISMHDTVEAFLFFRSSFSQLAMPLPGIAQPTDLAEAASLHARIQRFMDATLLGTIQGYEEQN